MTCLCWKVVVFSAVWMFTAFPLLAADEAAAGIISGTVVENNRKTAIVGAAVAVEGAFLSTTTDREGRFELLNVPVGTRTITISYLGFETVNQQVLVEHDKAAQVDVDMEVRLKTTVTVYGEPLLMGQAKALNEQLNAANIKNVVSADQIGRFPDSNTAEATQRIPGVSIERDQGEGRYVIIRGTEPRLSSTMINGERIPSPEGDVRQVALDVIPADLLESIEVTKALTADMDADAIGGAVNVITKGAPVVPRISLTLGGGYNSLRGSGLANFGGTYGRRILNNKLGLIASASYLTTDRASDDFEPSWKSLKLDSLGLRHYDLNRKRWGIAPSVDYRFSDESQVFFHGIFNRFDDQEYRQADNLKVGKGTIDRALKDRFETQRIMSFAAGGRHRIGDYWRIDYRVSGSQAQELNPNQVDTTFTQKNVTFAPNSNATFVQTGNIQANPLNEDTNLFQLTSLVRADSLTTDRDVVGSVDLARVYRLQPGLGGLLKFGARFRDKVKDRDESKLTYTPTSPVFLKDYLDKSFTATSLVGGRYAFPSAMADSNLARGLIGQPMISAGAVDPNAPGANFTANEKVNAGYAMSEVNVGESLMLMPGVRYEQASVQYAAPKLQFDSSGKLVSTTLLSGDHSYGDFLPSFHARYRLTDRTNLRAAVTRSLARPNYSDLAPFEIVSTANYTVNRGNPDLKTTTSTNFDLLGEHYFTDVGVISGGFFYKRLANIIYGAESQQTIDGNLYDVSQPVNGREASLRGLEVAFQKQLRSLPGPLGSLGVYLNYTLVDSDATLPDRTAILPGQARHVGNFSLSFERWGFSGRGSLNYHDKYLSEVGADTTTDLYMDKHLQLDLSASQRLTRWLRAYVDILNVTNEPLRTYQGFKNRPKQEEYYRYWLTAGLKIDF
jgi:TonB-dependent receptor